VDRRDRERIKRERKEGREKEIYSNRKGRERERRKRHRL